MERKRSELHTERESLVKGIDIIVKLEQSDGCGGSEGEIKMSDMSTPPVFSFRAPSISDDQQSGLGGFSAHYGDA